MDSIRLCGSYMPPMDSIRHQGRPCIFSGGTCGSYMAVRGPHIPSGGPYGCCMALGGGSLWILYTTRGALYPPGGALWIQYASVDPICP